MIEQDVSADARLPRRTKGGEKRFKPDSGDGNNLNTDAFRVGQGSINLPASLTTTPTPGSRPQETLVG